MLTSRAVVVALGLMGVLWLAFDAGVTNPPPPGTSVALGVFAFVFGIAAAVNRFGTQPERVPWFLGLALGAGGYAIVRTIAL